MPSKFNKKFVWKHQNVSPNSVTGTFWTSKHLKIYDIFGYTWKFKSERNMWSLPTLDNYEKLLRAHSNLQNNNPNQVFIFRKRILIKT